MIFSILNEHKFKLTILLHVSGLKKSTYYYELSKINLDVKNIDIIDKIKELFIKNKERYGVRRIYYALKSLVYNVNHKKVQRIMTTCFLSAKKHKQKYHSYQGTVGAVAKNLINRDFKANEPNRKWTTDVSQFSFSKANVVLVQFLTCTIMNNIL